MGRLASHYGPGCKIKPGFVESRPPQFAILKVEGGRRGILLVRLLLFGKEKPHAGDELLESPALISAAINPLLLESGA